MSGSQARPFFRVVPDEPDQVLRLARFREQHPGVTVVPLGRDRPWQAVIPRPGGETVITGRILRDLLDRLDEVLP